MGTSGPLLNGNGVVEVNLTGELSDEDKRIVEKLRQRDAEVRRHEQAHLAVAGQHALGGPSYTYQVGPDGQRYAIGGSVQIDLSPVANDPEATLRKAQQLQQAALAPANPSSTDRQVAMMASRMAQEAMRNIAEEKRNPEEEGDSTSSRREKTSSEDKSAERANPMAEGKDINGKSEHAAEGNTLVARLRGMEKVTNEPLAADGIPQAQTSGLAVAAFASSLADTGLDIYV